MVSSGSSVQSNLLVGRGAVLGRLPRKGWSPSIGIQIEEGGDNKRRVRRAYRIGLKALSSRVGSRAGDDLACSWRFALIAWIA
jgi:hypothetical protein